MNIDFDYLDKAYGSPGDWHYRIIKPDGTVELTSGGDMWRLWQSEDWESLFRMVWRVWRGSPPGTRIQLYVDGLMDTRGKRTAERGARSQIVHADIDRVGNSQLSIPDFFGFMVHKFKVTMRDAPHLLPEWVPHTVRSTEVKERSPLWEALL